MISYIQSNSQISNDSQSTHYSEHLTLETFSVKIQSLIGRPSLIEKTFLQKPCTPVPNLAVSKER